MIKRMNKVTSLLVAAAAMVSVVPANAATKLAIKEGTIENAIAFDGGYVFEGYKSDEDESGIYFNNGSKDSLLEDTEDADKLYKYGTKYAVAVDGNDRYMIDLSTGKVSDDDTDEDLKSTIETKLNTALKKTKRYKISEDDKTVVKDLTTKRLAEDQFGDVWYEYSATTSSNNGVKATGYTNQSGKYIDASVTANLYVLNADNKMVKVEEFNKKEDGITATYVDSTVIAQDSNYIYRVVTVKLDGAYELQYQKNDSDDKLETTRRAKTTAHYLQKISKAQGDKEDDAYLPKSVESYEISDTLGNKDAEKAYNTLVKASKAKEDKDKELVGIRAVDGTIYVTIMDYSEEEVTTYKLATKRSEKIEVKSDDKKYDVSILKQTDDVDTDAVDATIDVDGTVWAIYNGKISKSVKGGDFEVVYTCDRSLDRLDVYNEGNLIAWDSEGDVYTTVQEGKDAAKDEAEEIVKPEEVKTGWQSENGAWYLYDATGAKLTGWQNVGGTWYYMDPTTTAMRTGWLNDNGTWYYLQSSGAMKTGWLNDNGTWYYLQSSGAMKTGWLNDNGTWYYLQSSGAMKTGWLNDNGTWYYLNANGSMAANTTVDGYVLGANGAWIR